MLMLLLKMVMKLLSLTSLPAPETSAATSALLLCHHCRRCCRRRFRFCDTARVSACVQSAVQEFWCWGEFERVQCTAHDWGTVACVEKLYTSCTGALAIAAVHTTAVYVPYIFYFLLVQL